MPLMNTWRWIWVGLVLLGLIVIWVLCSVNRGLQDKIEAKMLQLTIGAKISDLKEHAAAMSQQASDQKVEAETAKKQADAIQGMIDMHKQALVQGLSDRGLSADEIAVRLANLNL